MLTMFSLRWLWAVALVFQLLQGSGAVHAAANASGLVVADTEEASAAGMEILKRGGNAVDAAIATAYALAVVDQASSGIGGGGFMVIYRAKEKQAYALDFRETAPAASRRELYTKDGKPVPSLSLTGALAVAVPSQVAGLAAAHKRFGSLPVPVLLGPAIRLATDGFPVDGALHYAIERSAGTINRFPDLARVYLPGGEVPKEGTMLRQPALAKTLKAVAQDGAKVFYHGWIADAVVETVKQAGGILSHDDLKSYRPVWRDVLSGTYRGRKIITMPPPSSGGVAMLQMLNVLEGYDLKAVGYGSTKYYHLLAEAMKHAFADRAQHLGDPDFVHVPVRKLTDKKYAEWVRSRIKENGTFSPQYYGYYQFHNEKGGTTHFSVMDRFGNAVACTLTVNTRFGSKLLVPKAGFVLNNEMDDFAIHGDVGNVYGLVGNDANALKPRKRPLSSMSPTIVVKDGRAVLVVGGAGGPRIINGTLQTILNVLDFGMPVKQAVEAARVHHQWLPERLDVEEAVNGNVAKSLEALGHQLRRRNYLGVVQAITSNDGTLEGAADPRKTER